MNPQTGDDKWCKYAIKWRVRNGKPFIKMCNRNKVKFSSWQKIGIVLLCFNVLFVAKAELDDTVEIREIKQA